MKVNNSNTLSPYFKSAADLKPQPQAAPAPPKKKGLLDKFETGIRNSADLNDTIQVPRTIFKGYLSIMTATTLITLAMMAKNKHKSLSNALNILSAGLMTYGTFSFVRPYLIKTPQEKKP